ncbi:uncharacterized protein LOC143361045 isoform X4 [Halictus rubicundus]|uniref:uncharacterized protein LOC143361045 isoform X4 n=1 Tax=Halictus rubicundus TaxID=77578 RepID=UPI00403704CA
MDMFRKNYNTYYNVLCITGLWPYDHTFLKKVQRVGYALLTVCCIVIQASTLRLVDISLYNLLQLLSFGFPMLLFFLRYVGFVVNFPVIRSVFDNIEYDCNSLKNPVEMELLMKQIVQSKRVVLSLLGLSCLGIVFAIAVFVVPTVLQSNLQIRYLNILGFFYPEISQHTNFVCCQLLIVTTFGLLTVTCTESSLAVFSSYLCGLFEITSYRIQMAVNAKAHSENSNTLIDIRSAMEMHRRAVELSTNLTDNMMLSYLVAIVAVIVSFAVNLYRLYLAFLELEKLDSFFISLQIFLVHVLIMFLNNYSGQKLMSTSIEVFHATYNSLWYCIPPKSQRMLLFVLMRSITEVQFNLAGLFVPCFEGFTMMMSSSFSYFTVLLSF